MTRTRMKTKRMGLFLIILLSGMPQQLRPKHSSSSSSYMFAMALEEQDKDKEEEEELALLCLPFHMTQQTESGVVVASTSTSTPSWIPQELVFPMNPSLQPSISSSTTMNNTTTNTNVYDSIELYIQMTNSDISLEILDPKGISLWHNNNNNNNKKNGDDGEATSHNVTTQETKEEKGIFVSIDNATFQEWAMEGVVTFTVLLLLDEEDGGNHATTTITTTKEESPQVTLTLVGRLCSSPTAHATFASASSAAVFSSDKNHRFWWTRPPRITTSPSGTPSTGNPTTVPSRPPSMPPSNEPTDSSTEMPSMSPTYSPIPDPSMSPTMELSNAPSMSPTDSPIPDPSMSPTPAPVTALPSSQEPTLTPVATMVPSNEPTRTISLSPTRTTPPPVSTRNSPTNPPVDVTPHKKFPTVMPTASPSETCQPFTFTRTETMIFPSVQQSVEFQNVIIPNDNDSPPVLLQVVARGDFDQLITESVEVSNKDGTLLLTVGPSLGGGCEPATGGIWIPAADIQAWASDEGVVTFVLEMGQDVDAGICTDDETVVELTLTNACGACQPFIASAWETVVFPRTQQSVEFYGIPEDSGSVTLEVAAIGDFDTGTNENVEIVDPNGTLLLTVGPSGSVCEPAKGSVVIPARDLRSMTNQNITTFFLNVGAGVNAGVCEDEARIELKIVNERCPPSFPTETPSQAPTREGAAVFGLQPNCFADDPNRYDICLDLFDASGTTQPWMKAFQSARDRWELAISGDIGPKVNPQTLTGMNFATQAPPFIDDVYITGTVMPIDGVGGTLGRAGPRFIRLNGPGGTREPGKITATAGIMEFDSADVTNLIAQGEWEDTILHEMGHVIGVGTLWQLNLLHSGMAGDSEYKGKKAKAEWKAIGCDDKLPIETNGGTGTAGGHWDESCLPTELLSGYKTSGIDRFSRITVASVGDMGYEVNYSATDPYGLGNVASGCSACKAASGPALTALVQKPPLSEQGEANMFQSALEFYDTPSTPAFLDGDDAATGMDVSEEAGISILYQENGHIYHKMYSWHGIRNLR